MEHVRAFVLAAQQARVLMHNPPVMRVIDGEKFFVGWTWGRMALGIDFGTMMDRLTAQVGHQRIHRLLAWVDGDTYGSFDTIERMQLENDAVELKRMACEAYSRMFPND
jgi:hypothetical protein